MQCVDGSASRTSWIDQLDGPAGTTSWPVPIFEDLPFSLYIVAASESDKGLVYLQVIREVSTFCILYFLLCIF